MVWGGMYTTQTKIREVYIHLVIFIPTGGIYTTPGFLPNKIFHPPFCFKQKCSYSNQADAVTGVVWGGMYKIREVIFIPPVPEHTTPVEFTGGIYTTPGFAPIKLFSPLFCFKQKCSYSNQAFLEN